MTSRHGHGRVADRDGYQVGEGQSLGLKLKLGSSHDD
jgi:hypothetical protein